MKDQSQTSSIIEHRIELRRFIWKAGIFLLPIIVMLFVTEYQLRFVPNVCRDKRTLLESRLDKIQVLNIGSSHEFNGINPREWNCQAINLAIGGQDIYYSNQIIDRYLDRMSNLQLVIIPISYLAFEYRLEDSLEEWRRFFYLHYFDLPYRQYSPYKFDPRDYSLIYTYSPSIAQEFILEGFKFDRYIEKFDDNGWSRLDGVRSPINPMTGKARVKFHEQMMKPEYASDNIAIIDRLITRLKAKNITVVLMTTPVCYTYSSNIDPDRYNTMQNRVLQLIQKHQITYRNYFSDRRFIVSDFSDNDHLNVSGANKLASIIKADIIDKKLVIK